MEQVNESLQGTDYHITSDIVLFFDMDGTLVDTNLANFLSYKKAVLAVTGKDYELTYNSNIRLNRSNLKNYVPNLSGNDYQQIIQEKEKYYSEFLSKTKLNKRVSDILFKYSTTNKTILVTNCREDRAIITLKYFGLENQFSFLLFREFEENNQKVNKFRNALEKLGIPPSLVIVFENEEKEIENAKIAGIKKIVKI